MKLRRPSRSRWAAKWVGLLLTAVLAVLFTESLFHIESYNCAPGADEWQFQLGNGAIVVAHLQPSPAYLKIAIDGLRIYPQAWTGNPGPLKSLIAMPLWIPLLPIIVVTVILCRLDRRHPKGHCQACGYNVAGADHDQCPECGTFLPAPRQVIGRTARVLATVSPEGGRVVIDRHFWQARPAAGDFVMDKGTKVIVRAFRGRCLLVSPKSTGPAGPPPRRRFG